MLETMYPGVSIIGNYCFEPSFAHMGNNYSQISMRSNEAVVNMGVNS